MEELPVASPFPGVPRVASAGSRTLLFTGAAGLAKLGCSVWMLVLSMAVSDMEVFAQEGVMPNVTLELGASGLMRFCACDVGTDPLGRGGKKRGALTSDALCSACHEPTDLVHFRRSLSRALALLPWIAMPLSLPGMVLRVARRCECPLRVFQVLLWAAIPAGILNIVVCVIVLLPADWDVFKSLCFIGHTFDGKYGVEITTPDELHQAFCTFSTLEQQALAAGWMLFVLELLSVLALAQTLHLPRKLASEMRKDGMKTVTSKLSALGGPITTFDSRGPDGSGGQLSADLDVESLRPLAAPWAQTDDFGLGISLWPTAGRSSYRESKSGSDKEEPFQGLSARSARSSDSRGRRRSRKPRKAKKKVLEEGEVDSEDLELAQLFATVGKRSPRPSARSPRRDRDREAVSPRRLGRAREMWDTAPAALQSLPSSRSIPPTADPSLASFGSAEEATRSLFHSMRSPAGLPAHEPDAHDALELAKSQAERDEATEGDDITDGDFFAYALRVSERFGRRQAPGKPDPTAHLQESLLPELFHPALPGSHEVSRL